MLLDYIPDNQGFDTLIVMPEHIADTRNLRPWHLSIQCLYVSRI